MFIKLTSCYDNSNETFPVLLNSDQVQFFDPVDNGLLKTRICFADGSIEVIEDIYYIEQALGVR